MFKSFGSKLPPQQIRLKAISKVICHIHLSLNISVMTLLHKMKVNHNINSKNNKLGARDMKDVHEAILSLEDIK